MSSRYQAAVLLCALSLLPRANAAAVESPSEPQDGVLVLRNGQVLSGAIRRTGDRYVVTLEGSGEVRLPAAEVEFACHDLEEAYRRKRGRIDPGNARGHLDLAEWCLRRRMLSAAADEVRAAMVIDPANLRSEQLKRRLLMLVDPPRVVRQPAVDRAPKIPEEAVESAIQPLRPEAVEVFAEKVQPLLLNRCSSAACHGPASRAKLRWQRFPYGTPAPRRVTRRNLYAALQWIDRATPEKSRLLTAPSGPHGKAAKPVFGPGDEQQRRLLAGWIHLVAGRSATTPHSRGESPAVRAGVPALVPAAPRTANGGSTGAPSDRQGPASRPPTTGAPVGELTRPGGSKPSRTAPQRGATLPRFIAKDPFDPEIFNRRYFGQRSP